MRWQLLCRRPLIVSRVRAARHRDLAIAVGLFREPLNDVVTVFRFLNQRSEGTFRIATATHVDCQKRVTVSGERHTAIVVAIAALARQDKETRPRLLQPLELL